ncbi:MAG: ferrous iron transport protein B [Negativicutes bacterium]|nr:ferrous iron transport protein B [Negativicutes bacterium]
MRTGKAWRIALVGNPNSGKTTLFNAITGAHHKVGNYAGVTVDIRQGRTEINGQPVVIYDLPGIYSLTAYSQDEIIARDFIIDERPDAIINVVDATNIERNLYLCLQLQELGIPLVVALNVCDQAENMGIVIDTGLLSQLLKVPVQPTAANRKRGVKELLAHLPAVVGQWGQVRAPVYYGGEIEAEITRIARLLSEKTDLAGRIPLRWLAVKLLEKDSDAAAKLRRYPGAGGIFPEVGRHIRHIEAHFGNYAEIIISEQRYAAVHGIVREAVRQPAGTGRPTLTQRIDSVLLHRFWGLPIFLVALWAVFQITFGLGRYPVAWLDRLFAGLGNWLVASMSPGIWQSLLVDGVIGGVGSVLSFVPLIVLLFLLISLLEDSGYMSRAAFIMDRFLHAFGLHGQSFLPMIIGFGCSVPAVMATRTLRSRKDRILSKLSLTFISCGAKLPVYTLLAAAFFPDRAGNVVMSVYLIGVAMALLSSIVLKKFVFKGLSTPFVMELPPYRRPTAKGIAWHVWDKTCHYFRKAATVILAASILVWLLTTFPVSEPTAEQIAGLHRQFAAEHPEATEADWQSCLAGYRQEQALANSAAGRLGQALAPVFAPLGFNWKIGVAAITGVSAKEVIVSTLGVLYRAGDNGDTEGGLVAVLRSDPEFTPVTAYGLMLYTLLSFPCLATLSAIRAEIGGGWLLFSMGYNLGLAWLVCWLSYQLGSAWF